MKQLEECLKELISEKTGFGKECIEIAAKDVKIDFERNHIEAYFWANKEEYLFIQSGPSGTWELLKGVQTWGETQPVLYTKRYYKEVYRRLKYARSDDDVRCAMEQIRRKLENNTFPHSWEYNYDSALQSLFFGNGE